MEAKRRIPKYTRKCKNDAMGKEALERVGRGANIVHALRTQLKRARNLACQIAYAGAGRWCPVCARTSRVFCKAGDERRRDARCAHCGALERHRFLWLYLCERTDLFDGRVKKMLHVAPERCFEPLIRERLGESYITADLSNPRAMVRMEITDIQFPDDTFDVIYCSHVLEHVQEDRRALKEFRRVLKPDGWAILLVPITAEKTIEDPSVVDPAERRRLYGMKDHVRRYGFDYVDRLREAGFQVTTITVSDLYGRDDAIRMGLTSESGEIYFCKKGRSSMP